MTAFFTRLAQGLGRLRSIAVVANAVGADRKPKDADLRRLGVNPAAFAALARA